MNSVARINSVRRVTLLTVMVFAAVFAQADLAAAAPSPVFKIVQLASPTNFAPGSSSPAGAQVSVFPQYTLVITNLGSEPTNGEITIVDMLPSGVAPAALSVPGARGPSSGTPFEPCAVSGLTVTCTITQSIAPGQSIRANIPVDVDLDAPSTVANRVTVSGGGAEATTSVASNSVSSSPPGFDFLAGQEGLSINPVDADGTAATLAGAHPYSLTLTAGFPSREYPGATEIWASGTLRNVAFSLPPGVVVDPSSTPLCTEAEFNSTEQSEGCPASTQVGTINIVSPNLAGIGPIPSALYNLVPPPGEPAEFGFVIAGVLVHVHGGLSGDFRLGASAIDVLAKLNVQAVQTELWGDPSDPAHAPSRIGFGCLQGGCQVDASDTPFLTMPSACSGPLELAATAASWEDTGDVVSRSALTTDVNGNPSAVNGCSQLAFSPTVTVEPTSQSTDSPTGLNVDIKLPQSDGINARATATLKKAVVGLPAGITVDPSAANGLGACSQAEIGLGTNESPNCPESSKVGFVEITTPLLRSPLKGSVYLAEQKSNPFGTLLALYLVAEGEGVVIKLPGRVDADPGTGQLTTTFDNNPQLPFEELKVDLNSGPRAALVTPSACGSFTTRTELTSWASPTPVVLSSPMAVTQGCSTGGFQPGFEAGTTNPSAGRYSAFTLRVTRADGEQNLSRISTSLPKGLLARLAGVPLCPDAQAATGDCPAASQVGTTVSGVGAGSLPLYLPQAGKAPTAVFLAGPYKGAPYSLVVKVPAQAGPFDLGTIAVRTTLNVDPFTAQVSASSDPLPQILEGIPVAYRDVRVNIDRPEFVRNPTSCEPMQVAATLISSTGATATPKSRFQVAECSRLAFKPSLKLTLKGSTKRVGHPALKAVLTYPKSGEFANIARAQVNLPNSEFLDQENLNKTCTRPVLLEGKCPKSTVYGKAKAWTPLLDKPLEGPVYLVGGFGYKLPAIVADLNGQIRVLLVGKVDSGPNKGIRNTFEAVPDAPVSRFVLELKGGKKYSLLENSENLCRKPQRAITRFTGQNGAVESLHPLVANQCGKKKRHSKGSDGKGTRKKK
jgi:hypothetical protein